MIGMIGKLMVRSAGVASTKFFTRGNLSTPILNKLQSFSFCCFHGTSALLTTKKKKRNKKKNAQKNAQEQNNIPYLGVRVSRFKLEREIGSSETRQIRKMAHIDQVRRAVFRQIDRAESRAAKRRFRASRNTPDPGGNPSFVEQSRSMCQKVLITLSQWKMEDWVRHMVTDLFYCVGTEGWNVVRASCRRRKHTIEPLPVSSSAVFIDASRHGWGLVHLAPTRFAIESAAYSLEFIRRGTHDEELLAAVHGITHALATFTGLRTLHVFSDAIGLVRALEQIKFEKCLLPDADLILRGADRRREQFVEKRQWIWIKELQNLLFEENCHLQVHWIPGILNIADPVTRGLFPSVVQGSSAKYHVSAKPPSSARQTPGMANPGVINLFAGIYPTPTPGCKSAMRGGKSKSKNQSKKAIRKERKRAKRKNRQK